MSSHTDAVTMAAHVTAMLSRLDRPLDVAPDVSTVLDAGGAEMASSSVRQCTSINEKAPLPIELSVNYTRKRKLPI